MANAWRYALIGVLVDCGLLMLTLLLIVGMAVVHYDGKCGLGIILGGGRHECSLLEYVWETLLLLGFVIIFELWRRLLLVLAAPPFVGFLLGLARPKMPSLP